ncbi:MAG TPA: hypothetical protein VFV66_02360 [Nonomuraea sp.]|nr:hypothetical protein [Nonomuraea sp.]
MKHNRWGKRLALTLVAMTVSFGAGLAPATASTGSSELPQSAWLAPTELPAVPAGDDWSGPSRAHLYYFDLCSPNLAQGAEAVRMSYTLDGEPIGEAQVTVLRFATDADAARAHDKWVNDRRVCADVFGPSEDWGATYAQDVDVVSTVDGVDVYGVHLGVNGYLQPPNSVYSETFGVRSGRTLYFVSVGDHAVRQTHATLDMAETVAAAKRRLATIG